MQDKKVAVLIPCYNEETTIARVVEDFRRLLPEAVIYVYDNNSTDNSKALAEKAGAVVSFEPKQGKGNVVRTMFREIEADCYILVDGDDTYPAEHAVKMSEMVMEHKVDMVIGDRLSSTYFTENKRRFHGFGNKMVRSMINWLFNGDIHDVMTGYRAFSKLFVKSFPVVTKGFEIETEMTIHALDKNMTIYEMPIEYRDRPDGSISKLDTYGDGFKVLRTIARLFRDYKPLAFFSIFFLLFFLIGAGLFVDVTIEFFRTGLVERMPTFVIAIMLMVSALLLLSCGIILHVINNKHRQLYEIQLNIIRKLYE